MTRKMLFVALSVLVVAIVSGCGYQGPQKYTGGGWIQLCDYLGNPYLKGNTKATFGFEFQGVCSGYDDDGQCGEACISGQLEWQDHARGVSFHGIVDNYKYPCRGGICFSGADCVTGDYTPQPANLGEGGKFTLCVLDSGEQGPDSGDKISIKLQGGYFGWYKQYGTYLGGGNIVAHD